MLSRDRLLKLVWMSRPDLRRGAASGAHLSREFQLWWEVEGGASIPAWHPRYPLPCADLLAPAAAGDGHGRFGMGAVLAYLMERRADLGSAFDVSTDDGVCAALAWLFTHGLREYGLLERLGADALAELDATPPFLVLHDAGAAARATPNWLMLFVWRSADYLQDAFDLHTVEGQALYIQWFLLDGVANLQLQALVAPRWRDWLRHALPGPAGATGVPRAAMLLWYRRPELQARFDLRCAPGRLAFGAWAEQAWTDEPCLAWVGQPPAAAAPRPPGVPPARPFGVNLIGFAFGELGIGEDVRMAVAACEAAGIPFSVVNIDPGAAPRQDDRLLERHVRMADDSAQAPYAVNVFCLTAFDTARIYLERGMALFEGRYNIGWWPWELPVWPRDWAIVFDLVDEVWAATTFTQRMYTQAIAAAAAAVPVRLMPLAASVRRATPARRGDLGIPQASFVFLYVFDFNSYPSRKNPCAALEAFAAAFDVHDRSVALVLKTMNGKPDDPLYTRFLAACRRDPRVVVLDRTMERGAVLGLVDACDAYVSLHRSEGFGRTLAEVMLFGKPVVATDFSGNTDFLHAATGFPVRWRRSDVGPDDYPFVTAADGAWWAEPDIAHAAEQMRAARQGAADARFGQQVRAFAQTQFSERRIGQRMLARLGEIARHAGRERMLA